jgi:branched-chain amino acid transport system permease protein
VLVVTLLFLPRGVLPSATKAVGAGRRRLAAGAGA